MRIVLLPVILFMAVVASGQEKDYAVNKMPVELIHNAHAVKRMEEVKYHIVRMDEAVLTKKWAVTVLDEKGEEFAQLNEYYDQMISITSVSGSLYDANGKRVKDLKKKDISDLSAVDDNNLMDDSRRKSHRFYHNGYPYTVQYEIQCTISNTFFFPSWLPRDGEYLSVEQSRYTLVCPANYQIRYRQFNYRGDPVITTDKKNKKLQWDTGHLMAIARPFAAPSWSEFNVSVRLAPAEFEIQGYRGDMSTWQNLGKFQFALNNNRDRLPENIKQKVKELVSGVRDERQKVAVLYEYFQKNTRYISVQMGLGGWQPFEAAYVAQKGYGDCKALTNYMHSLLKAADISSNYVLVWAGYGNELNLLDDFPSQQFNHAILCVPFQQDSIWLECTNSFAKAGYLGRFTGNRKALLINENGGFLVSTPAYGIKENTLDRKVAGKVALDGTLEMQLNAVYRYVQQDRLAMIVNQLSKEKVEQVLQNDLELSTYTVNTFHYTDIGNGVPALKEDLEITAPSYATVSGKRMFIAPNILNRYNVLPEKGEGRTADFVFHLAYRDNDDYVIDIPQGYQIESLPQEVAVKSLFGSYFASVRLEGNQIIYHRTMEQNAGRFPASMQEDLIRFYTAIYKADRNKVVLVKKS